MHDRCSHLALVTTDRRNTDECEEGLAVGDTRIVTELG